jgi:adenine-specific DNA-methyltransferase
MVIANPPYALFTTDGKRAAKNHNLSRDFVLKSLKIVKENGYLVFLIPDNWMSLADRNDVVKNLSCGQFIWLNIHGAKKWFNGIGSSFTWFIFQNTKNEKKFFVENTYKMKDVVESSLDANASFIPLYYSDIVKSILDKTINVDNLKFQIKTSSLLHKYTKKDLLNIDKNDIYKYKVIHTPSQTVWSKVPHLYQSGWKVFISLTDKYKTFIDVDCGMTQSIAFILVENKNYADLIKKILDHPLYVFLNNICRFGNFNNIRVLQKFPVPNNENIYNSFSLNKEEIELIEHFNSI